MNSRPPSAPLGIILGTANLEQSYGSKGKKSKLTRREAEKILAELLLSADGMIETSAGYGNAEKIIGEILGGQKFDKIITKIAPRDFVSADKVIESVTKSLENLGQSSIRTVMLHGGMSEALANKETVQEGLHHLLEQKLVYNVGYSAYEESEVIRIKESFPILSEFQLPENMADQRCINSERILDLAQDGNNFQVRSIFLQGKLFFSVEEALRNFPEIVPTIRKLEELAAQFDCEKLDICLAYAKSIPWAHQIVVGVQSHKEYQAIFETLQHHQFSVEYFGRGLDATSVDPRNWAKGMIDF